MTKFCLLFAATFGYLQVNGTCKLIAQDVPSQAEVVSALHNATKFMRDTIADHGGYAWVSSIDGQHRMGEAVTPPGTIWIQPPGTPSIGMAFLIAHQETNDPIHLEAATEVGEALIQTQLRSGGWNYRGEFLPEKRESFRFRVDLSPRDTRLVPTEGPGGWDVWKRKRHRDDMTILDDNTTQAALQFMMELDRALEFENEPIHEAVEYALRSVCNAQYPIGAWSHNYDQFPLEPPALEHYPIRRARVPNEWSREWTKDYSGCYMINDRITLDMIRTLLCAAATYDRPEYRRAAEQGGDFLILAQLPAPQPAWAQQYNRAMEPVWDRAFEPPAITGLESQDTIATLIQLFHATGEERFLDPIEPALDYLETCLLDDRRLARYYELRTNRPLYFTSAYELTYDSDDVPDHYRFQDDSRLDRLREALAQARRDGAQGFKTPFPGNSLSAAEIAALVGRQESDGSWREPGTIRDEQGRKQIPAEGVIYSATMADNIGALAKYLREADR